MQNIKDNTHKVKKQLDTLRDSLSDKEKLDLGSFMGVILNYKGILGTIDNSETEFSIATDPKNIVIAAPSIYNIVGCIDHITRELEVDNNTWQVVYIEELVELALNGDLNSLRILFYENKFETIDLKLIRKGIMDAFSNKYMKAKFLINIIDEFRYKIETLEEGNYPDLEISSNNDIRKDELLCCILDYVGTCVAINDSFSRDELNKIVKAAKYDIVETEGLSWDLLGKLKKQWHVLNDILKSIGVYEYKEGQDQIDASIMMYRYSIMKPLVCHILNESGIMKYRAPGEEGYEELVTQLIE